MTGGNGWSGYMMEVIAFSSYISAPDRQTLEVSQQAQWAPVSVEYSLLASLSSQISLSNTLATNYSTETGLYTTCINNLATETSLYNTCESSLTTANAQASVFIVDLLSASPAGAYSLRKLRSAYAGNCITVKRASDSTTSNIGFVNNMLDVSTLMTFCSQTNCTVTTWFDQSTNGVNLVAGTAAPLIVLNGMLIIYGGAPAIRTYPADGSYMSASLSNSGTGLSILQVATQATTASGILPTLISANSLYSNGFSLALNNLVNYGLEVYQSGFCTSGGYVLTSNTLYSIAAYFTGSAAYMDINGATQTSCSKSPTFGYTSMSLFTADSYPGQWNDTWDGAVSEVIVYNSYLSSSDRTAAETNQKAFWQNSNLLPAAYMNNYIYSMLTYNVLDFVSATPVAAYSMRKLYSRYRGPCLRVFNSANSVSTDIGFAGGYVDTAAIQTACYSSGNTLCRVTIWYDQSGLGNNAIGTGSTAPLIAGGTPLTYVYVDGVTIVVDIAQYFTTTLGSSFTSSYLSAMTIAQIPTGGNSNQVLAAMCTSGANPGTSAACVSWQQNGVAGATVQMQAVRNGANLNPVSLYGTETYSLGIFFDSTYEYATVGKYDFAGKPSTGALSAGAASSGTFNFNLIYLGQTTAGGTSQLAYIYYSEFILWSSFLSTADRLTMELSQYAYV
jgi:hypothetical protein